MHDVLKQKTKKEKDRDRQWLAVADDRRREMLLSVVNI